MEVATSARPFTTSSASTSSSRLHNSSGSSIAQIQSQPGSQSSTWSSQRISDSTQDTTASTLFSHSANSSTPILSNGAGTGGPVSASQNVINRVADKEASLFQICLIQRNRLKAVPAFEEQIQITEAAAEENEHDEGPLDPVSLLWRTYRRGYPLMAIYNALQPAEPLQLDSSKLTERSREKAAAFKFLKACVEDLQIPKQECFIISDLYGEDTTGFVKVINVVNRVVDLLAQRGLIDIFEANDPASISGPATKRTHRQNVVDELVRTERTYVQHLELLQEFKKLVGQKGIIHGDAIHDIFLNLDALLDFQRRFLIRVEQTNALPEEEQNWGQLFKMYANAFKVYEPYIANQKQCEFTAYKEFPKLKETGGRSELRQLVENSSLFCAFLLKPFQRLSKYPLLLQQLRDKGDLDPDRQNDISEGIDAVQSVLTRTNAFIAKQERLEAVESLKHQIDDWRNHDVNAFGELLLHGTFQVIKGDGQSTAREYKIYLFERILLCCKDLNAHKTKNKSRTASQAGRQSRPKMQLRGRIFMQNVSDVSFVSRVGEYTCRIFWRSDDQDEYFIIQFPTDETLKDWQQAIDTQRKICEEQARAEAEKAMMPHQQHPQSLSSQSQGTSNTEFNYMRDQMSQLENPHLQNNFADDDEDADSNEYSQQSRNASSSSLRSGAGAGEPGPSTLNQYPPRTHFPAGIQGVPLTLRTHHLNHANATSPSERGGNSYFSPVAESPISASTRTSNSSGVFNFPRPGQQGASGSGGHPEDQQNRFTAPALGRTSNGYYTDQRGRGQPGHMSAHQLMSNQPRLRSTSNPDIHQRKPPSTIAAPPVPSVPSHLAQNAAGIINRSPNSSPTNHANHVVSKSSSHSPLSQLQNQGSQTATDDRASHQSQHSHHLSQPHNSMGTTSPLGNSALSPEDLMTPSQLRIKVRVPSAGTTMVLVVPYNISFSSLKDRIDAKLQRTTSLTLANGHVVLKYWYEDVWCSIQTDDDVQTAFESYREQGESDYVNAQNYGEIELFCQVHDK